MPDKEEENPDLIEDEGSAAEAEASADEVDEEEIARMEAEMAAAVADQEESAAAPESGDEVAAEAADPLSGSADTSSVSDESSADEVDEEEIARMEAEMAAAVAEAEGEPEVEAENAEDQEAEVDGVIIGRASDEGREADWESAPPMREISDDDLGPIAGVSVPVSVVIFDKSSTIGELLTIEVGSIIRGHSSDQPLLVRVGQRPLAYGRAVVVDDRFGVIVDEMIDA